ncbi:MAG: TlpA family protein disulfide reductase [Bacteroidales bacterium]|nr:TlpA family protein disulfide reductase [Bacteroidales bacterium]
MTRLLSIILLLMSFSTLVSAQSVETTTSYKHYEILNPGQLSPNIVLKDINAKEASLSYLKGRYILIQFWASWCKPCRAENPIIKNTYIQFKDKKFKNGNEFLVLSISLDEDTESWKKAVHEDNIYEFINVIDTHGVDSDIAKQYNVSSIPANYLIDGQGKIVAKNFRASELSNILNTLKN